jgi:hypothetical protein
MTLPAPSELSAALGAALAEALLEGAFLFASPTESRAVIDGPGAVHAMVRLGANPAWVLALSVPRSLARRIAQDTLGELDPEAVAESDVEGAVLELLNIAAGRVARQVSSGATLLSISPPERLPAAPPMLHASTLESDDGVLLSCGVALETL